MKINPLSFHKRANIDLIKASDLNERLRNRGIESYVTIQKICRYAKDEKEVRDTLQKSWNQPSKGREFLTELTMKNKVLYEFEETLENTSKLTEPITKIPKKNA